MLVAMMAGSAFFAPAATASRVATTRPAVRMSSGEDPTANPLTQVACSQIRNCGRSPSRTLILALYPHQPERVPTFTDTSVLAPPPSQAINSLQEAMQNSPVANLKQSLAKMQAGDYDVDAVSARLNGLITDTPVVMFSFST